jgi:hypothetical protein
VVYLNIIALALLETDSVFGSGDVDLVEAELILDSVRVYERIGCGLIGCAMGS